MVNNQCGAVSGAWAVVAQRIQSAAVGAALGVQEPLWENSSTVPRYHRLTWGAIHSEFVTDRAVTNADPAATPNLAGAACYLQLSWDVGARAVPVLVDAAGGNCTTPPTKSVAVGIVGPTEGFAVLGVNGSTNGVLPPGTLASVQRAQLWISGAHSEQQAAQGRAPTFTERRSGPGVHFFFRPQLASHVTIYGGDSATWLTFTAPPTPGAPVSLNITTPLVGPTDGVIVTQNGVLPIAVVWGIAL